MRILASVGEPAEPDQDIRRGQGRPPHVTLFGTAGLLLLSATTALAFSQEATKASQPALQVIAAYVAALGGNEALSQITSRRTEGRLDISNRGDDHQKFITYWRAPDLSRVKVNSSEDYIDTGFDGKAGWRVHLDTAEPLNGRSLELVLRDANPLRYARLGELYPDVVIDDQPPEDAGKRTVLVSRDKDETTRFYFDPETHLLTELTTEQANDQTGVHHYLFEDYKKVDGVLFPFAIREIIPIPNADPRAVHIEHVMRFKKVQQNVSLPDVLFTPAK